MGILPDIPVFAAFFRLAPSWYDESIWQMASMVKGDDCMLTAYLWGLEGHIYPALAIFLAAVLQSITGFGLVIVAAPLLMLFYDPKLTVPVMLMLACCANLAQGVFALRTANRKLVLYLYLGVLCGQPIGFFVFDHASSAALKVFISVIVLLSLGTIQALHYRIRECPRNSWITGIFSGFTSITAGMGGPPFLIYLAYSKMQIEVMRATCFVFFFLCNATSLTSYALGGLSFGPAWNEFIYLLPALVLGIVSGHLAYPHVPKDFVRRLIYVLLYLTCFYTIATVLLD